ncbi:MAG: TIGR02444 family protein, partial [Brevundimonas sp.]|uniref:TIGR02444 family protein n=1 Tax=Brevundimonas sp. TaxID=1871086 RepID=UPI00261DB66F
MVGRPTLGGAEGRHGRMSDLWDWAVRAYASDGVGDACLHLQDAAGQNVPLLLWASGLRPVRAVQAAHS